MPTVIIYGATGFTGGLITNLAVSAGLVPIIAGRNEASLRKLGSSLGVGHRVFGLDSLADIDTGLSEAKVLFNSAGPYHRTAGASLMPVFATEYTTSISRPNLTATTYPSNVTKRPWMPVSCSFPVAAAVSLCWDVLRVLLWPRLSIPSLSISECMSHGQCREDRWPVQERTRV
jgi:hypothetical protein